MVRLIDLTEAHRILDNIKSPDKRVLAARDKTLDLILSLIEGITEMRPVETPKV